MNIADFEKSIPITKGWSSDKKYCVTDCTNTQYLLRISSMDKYDKKLSSFKMMSKLYDINIPMCRPIDFGICGEGCYSLQSWIDGDDLESIIHTLSTSKQYEYGFKSGQILKSIHSFPAPENQENWDLRFNRKMDYNIQKYNECPIKYDNGQNFIDYINSNRHLLKDRPQVYQHGDYHIGNMMIDKKLNLQIIDFDRDDFGDPWEEFNRIVWCARKSPLFATGMVDGYFLNNIPTEFWGLLALYIASNTLSSIFWAIPFGKEEISTSFKLSKEVSAWYDNMENYIPTWYQPVDK